LKTCLKCGKKVPESAGFCPFCGVKLDEEKRAASRKSGLRRKINPKVGKRGGRQAKSFKGTKIQPKVKSHVLVDGSNVIWYGEKAWLKNLQLLMRKLDENGHRYSVFVDASMKYDLNESERRTLERMISDGTVHQVPAKTSADEWILEYATNHPECRILSNDAFQDWESKYPVVNDRDRFITFMIVDDEVMLPKKEAGQLPEEVDLEIYCGATYTSYGNYHKVTEGKSQPPPEPSPTLLERVKKMARPVDGFSIEVYLINREVRSVALIGYGKWDMRGATSEAESITQGFFKDEVFIEKTIPIWGEGKSRPIPGVAVILRKSTRPGRSKPATKEVLNDELMKKALRIVEIASFLELKQSIHNKQRLAKLIYERVLLPVPDWCKRPTRLGAGRTPREYDDELDVLLSSRILKARGLRINDDIPLWYPSPKVQITFHFRKPEKKWLRNVEGGWFCEVVLREQDEDGCITGEVSRCTRVSLRRVEAAIDAVDLLDQLQRGAHAQGEMI